MFFTGISLFRNQSGPAHTNYVLERIHGPPALVLRAGALVDRDASYSSLGNKVKIPAGKKKRSIEVESITRTHSDSTGWVGISCVCLWC